MTVFLLACSGILAAMFGSFFNVVILRMPVGESVIRPRSRCMGCGTTIRPYDNVPVLSWLLLRGRCRDCRQTISVRYPLIELVTVVLCIGVLAAKGASTASVLGVLLTLTLIPLTIIDLEHRILPNVIVAVGCVLALLAGTLLDSAGEPVRLAAGAGAAGVLLAVALIRPGGMGMGDVKLAGMLGLFLGTAVIPGMFIGFLVGAVLGVAIMARRGVSRGRKTAIPFGPFLAFGAYVAIFAGHPLISLYTHHLIR